MKGQRRWQWISLAVVLAGAALSGYFIWRNQPRCEATYAALSKDGAISILIAFGYKDSRPTRFVGDRYDRAVLVDLLVRPCRGREAVCGFIMEKDNPEYYSKKIEWYDGKERIVQIQILASSIGPDDEWNRNSDLQTWNSDRTLRLFRRALVKSDVVFYSGHSRTGGGPDFSPPHLVKSGQVDYRYYQNAREGAKLLLEDLARARGARQPRLLGLFSCESSDHFQKMLLKAKPKMGLIASEALLHQSDSMKNIVAALTAILKGECAEAFNNRLRAGDPMTGSQIVGFF